MNHTKKALLVLAASCASAAAMAGSDSGFYIGGSVGNADLDYSHSGIKFNDGDTAYKIFAGYNFGLVPFLNLAVEGAYVNFGEPQDKVNGVDVKVEPDAFTLQGLVGFDLGPVGLFAKAGVADWHGDVKTFAGNDSESGTDPVYGVGAKVQLGSFAVRAEYEYYDFDKFNIDYFSVGASYTF